MDSHREIRKKRGRISFANGDYEGDYTELITSDIPIKMRSGKGVMRYCNGNIYAGEWVEDYFDGFGEYSWSDGRKFSGHFKQDKMIGKGTGVWPDGRKYEGEYRMDLAHGHGRAMLADGRAFEGEFRDDFPIAGLMVQVNGDAFRVCFDGRTHVSDWRQETKVPVGFFELGCCSTDPFHALREFVWSDGRRFAGSCSGFCPLVGVLTTQDGVQSAVAYSGSVLFSDYPVPIHSIRLQTKVSTAPGFLIICQDEWWVVDQFSKLH